MMGGGTVVEGRREGDGERTFGEAGKLVDSGVCGPVGGFLSGGWGFGSHDGEKYMVDGKS